MPPYRSNAVTALRGPSGCGRPPLTRPRAFGTVCPNSDVTTVVAERDVRRGSPQRYDADAPSSRRRIGTRTSRGDAVRHRVRDVTPAGAPAGGRRAVPRQP